jgi:prepilin-type N-terminal cleavage/methylation domain-containing protein
MCTVRSSKTEAHRAGRSSTFTRGRTRPNARAFTLLEIMLAVAVLALVTLSIYRFVEGTLSAIRDSEENAQREELNASLIRFLKTHLFCLSSDSGSVLLGTSHRFDQRPSDELQWKATAGNALFTRHAEGEWNVTLTAKPVAGSKEFEMGLRRQETNGKRAAEWLPLFSGVNGFEVQYFDPRSMRWMEKWTESNIRPSLLRVRLWQINSPDPYEAILRVPVAPKMNATSLLGVNQDSPSGQAPKQNNLSTTPGNL